MLNKNSYYLMLAGLIAMPGTALGDDCDMFKAMFNCVRDNYSTWSADDLSGQWKYICERCYSSDYDACAEAGDSVGGAFYNCWSAGYKTTATGCVAANDGEVTNICPMVDTSQCYKSSGGCAQGEYWDESEEICSPCPGAIVMYDDEEYVFSARTTPGSGCYSLRDCYIPKHLEVSVNNQYGYATLKLGSSCYHNGSI